LVAAVTFGDVIGWRRLTAIAIGFLGVIIIVRPGAEGFDGWSLLGVGSMLCVVVRDLATRKISRRVPSMTVALLAALSVTIAAGLMLPFLDWVPVAPSHLRHIAYAAAFLVCGYLTVVMSMRVGDVAYVAPFRYFSLLAAVVLGLIFFDEVPDGWTIIGSIVVVLTGIYTFYRERRVAAEDQAAQG
ncbi:MAG: DMT family transporter, partial [Paracoccaceae bacterium]